MKSSSPPVPIVISMGDPAGIGPEVVVKALASREVAGRVAPIVVGSSRTLKRAAGLMGSGGSDVKVVRLGSPPESLREVPLVAPLASGTSRRARATDGRAIFVVTPSGMPRSEVGARARGQASFACVKEAARLCRLGIASGLVTAPISKSSLRAAGFRFPGHTQMLRNLCGSKRTVMMFVCEGLRVSLVTTHVPVSRVAKELSKAEIQGVIALTKKALALLFGITGPRMAVLALNPHAGEEGLLGSEERRVILPAIRAARRRGAFVEGPFPADSFFSRGRWKEFDATIAMYHDQALIPAKLMGGDRVVNLTLGLPFVRTSPAHGTAEEIAWQGRASAEGMVAAILLAAELSEKVRLPLRWGLGSTI